MQTKELKPNGPRALVVDNLDEYIRDYGLIFLQETWGYGDAPIDNHTFWNEVVREEDDIAEFMGQIDNFKSYKKGYGTFDLTAEYYVQPFVANSDWVSMDEDQMHEYVEDCLAEGGKKADFIDWIIDNNLDTYF